MPLALAYPSSRFAPVSMIDLSVRAERECLTPAALNGFYKLIAAWDIRDEDSRELLGGIFICPARGHSL